MIGSYVTPSGQTDGGVDVTQSYTPEGHSEIAIHDPILPFGSIHTEKLTPIFQSDGVYGINSGQELTVTTLSGTATVTDGMFTVTTGTTSLAQGVILGRKRLRYRAGQGVVGRLTARFPTLASYSYLIAGFGHSEDGIYFACKEIAGGTPKIGFLKVDHGVRETRTLTVTVGATSSGNVTITLNDVAFAIAVTNASNIQRTVYEISQGSYAGWDAYPAGATVVFLRKAAGVTAGAYSFSAGTTGSAASMAQTKAGAATTETFVPQDEWNGDRMDGSAGDYNKSGVKIDYTKLNIFDFHIGYLGTDNTVIKCKVEPPSSNNSTWITVHTFAHTNSRVTPIFGNPSFPFTMAAYSAGSTTDISVQCGSFAGFIEGTKVLHGNRFSYYGQSTAVDSSAYRALFTIMNARYYGGRSNQAVINLLSSSGALKHTSPCIFYLIRGGTLTGNPNFQTVASNSCSLWDTASTVVSGGEIVWTAHLGDTGEFDHHFGNGEFNAEEITLQPGEWMTLAAKSVTGTPSYVTGSINTREDQ